jgi:hypothetical protein
VHSIDDDPEAVKKLVTAAKAGENTAHVAQRLRDNHDTTTPPGPSPPSPRS